jgi:hypothetical protein
VRVPTPPELPPNTRPCPAPHVPRLRQGASPPGRAPPSGSRSSPIRDSTNRAESRRRCRPAKRGALAPTGAAAAPTRTRRIPATRRSGARCLRPRP